MALLLVYAGIPLVEQTEAHVLIGLLGLFLLLLLLGSSGSVSSVGSGGSTTSGGGGTGRGSHVSHQVLDVHALQGLGEQAGPVGLNADAGCLQDGGQLVGRDSDLIVSEDQCGINARQLVVGCHYFCFANFHKSPKGLSKLNK